MKTRNGLLLLPLAAATRKNAPDFIMFGQGRGCHNPTSPSPVPGELQIHSQEVKTPAPTGCPVPLAGEGPFPHAKQHIL